MLCLMIDLTNNQFMMKLTYLLKKAFFGSELTLIVFIIELV